MGINIIQIKTAMTIRFSIKTNLSKESKFSHHLSNNTRVPVYVRIRDGRSVDQTVRTRILVNPIWWNPVREEVRPNSSCTEEERLCINLEILSLRNKLVAKYVADRALVGIGKDWLRNEVYPARTAPARTLDSMFAEFIREHDISDARKEQYLQALHILGRFELFRKKNCNDKSKDLDFTQLDKDWVDKLQHYMLNEHRLDGFAAKNQRPRSQNTVNDILKKLRTFFKWCTDKEYIDKSPFDNFQIGSDMYGTPVCLTPDEVRKVYRADIRSESLRRQQDVFIFQCNVGCRVGDLMRLTEENCADGYISYIPSKTMYSHADTVTVPLNKTALSIIARYKGRCDGKLLPFISVQKYNDAIKKILKIAGITRQVAVLDPLSRTEKRVSICDVGSSHMARRTFINNLYHKVKDPALVSSLTGHKDGSKAFQRYRNIDFKLKCELVEMLE